MSKNNLFYVLDLDGVLLASNGDWTAKGLVPENLANAWRIKTIPPDRKVVLTGRHNSQQRDIEVLFASQGIEFAAVFCRDWGGLDPEGKYGFAGFYLRYWKWKVEMIQQMQVTYAGGNPEQLVAWEDDAVLCAMFQKFNIHHEQFVACAGCKNIIPRRETVDAALQYCGYCDDLLQRGVVS